MNKIEKTKVIEELVAKLEQNNNFYLADTSSMSSEKTTLMRRMCYDKQISMLVVKNSLLKKALERSPGKDFQPLISGALKGTTAVLFCEAVSAPGKLIKEFRRKDSKPVLKGAFIETVAYVGDDQLDFLASIKSKNELIGEIIGLLQSPARTVISALLNKKDTESTSEAAAA